MGLPFQTRLALPAGVGVEVGGASLPGTPKGRGETSSPAGERMAAGASLAWGTGAAPAGGGRSVGSIRCVRVSRKERAR